MLPKISICCYVKNAISIPFGLWESMAQLMPFADEYIIMDCGSDDGTLELLKELQLKNPKIKLCSGSFLRNYDEQAGKPDPKIFADLANELIAMCRNEVVLYHQADEIWHDDLIALMEKKLREPNVTGMSFWRYQLQENFQVMKWWPHQVKRIGLKSDFNFIGDGMNAESKNPSPMCCSTETDQHSGRWQEVFKDEPSKVPLTEMILDISMTGGFLENIPPRARAHAPIWRERPNVGGMDIVKWYEKERKNPNWKKPESPFNIPRIMKDLVGLTRYYVRPSVLDMIANPRRID